MKSKKIIGMTLVGMTLISSVAPVFAEYNPSKVTDQPIPVLISQQPQDLFKGHLNIVVNDKGLNPQETKAYIKEDGKTMIPLRLVGEALGYEVKWNNQERAIEMVKGPQWIMLKIGADQYGFGKMAPVAIGTAPEIKDGTTYVPLNFVTDILKLEVMRDEIGTINIQDKQSPSENISMLGTEGEIKEINETDKYTSIHIEGIKTSENAYDSIVLHISEKTKIINPLDGKILSGKDLKKGDRIRAFYGPAVTRSLPPIGNAEKIEVLNDTAVKEGEITDISIGDKYSRVLVGSMTDGVMLIISDETQIVTEDNKKLSLKELQKGMKITAYHDLVMTMSIPGQTGAKKIVVSAEHNK